MAQLLKCLQCKYEFGYCGGLTRNTSHRLMCLNVGPQEVGLLVGVALLGEVGQVLRSRMLRLSYGQCGSCLWILRQTSRLLLQYHNCLPACHHCFSP